MKRLSVVIEVSVFDGPMYYPLLASSILLESFGDAQAYHERIRYIHLIELVSSDFCLIQ